MLNLNQISVMDMLNILSFYAGIKNLDENINQNDLQEILNSAIKDIHTHLEAQDKKIDKIVEVISNDKNKKVD